MKTEQRKQVLFMATDTWLGRLDDSYSTAMSYIQDRTMLETYDPGHFLDISRLDLRDFEMRSPVRMSVADVYGRLVVDARCHPTKLVPPAIIAPSQRKLMKKLESYLPADCDEEYAF